MCRAPINWSWSQALTEKLCWCRRVAVELTFRSSQRRGMKPVSNMLKIGLVQTKVSGDLEENLAKTALFIKQAAKKGAEIVCLQELFAYRYFAQTKNEQFFGLAEPVSG